MPREDWIAADSERKDASTRAAPPEISADAELAATSDSVAHEQGREGGVWSRIVRRHKRPAFLAFRSHEMFITFVVGYGIFVDLAVYGIAAPVVPFRLRELGYDNVSSLTGWLVAAYAGGLIVSSPIIGYLGEKTRGRQMPLILCLLFMIGALIMFMLSTTFPLLLVSRILQGVSGTGVFVLGFALLADCVSEERMAVASGHAMIGLALGSVCGPAIGGALYDHLGYYAPWIFSICLVTVDLLLRLVIVEPYRAARWKTAPAPVTANELEQKERQLITETTEKDGVKVPSPLVAFAKLTYQPRAIASMLIALAFGVLFGNFDAALTLRLNQRYGLNSTGAGLVFIAFAVPALIISPLAGFLADKYGQKPVALVGIISICPFIALLTISTMNLAAFVVVLTLVGAAGAVPMPPCSADLAAIVRDTPGLGFAHAYSLFNLSFSVGSFIGPLMAGQILEALGIGRGWYTMVGVTVAFFLVAVPPVYLYYPAWRPQGASGAPSSSTAADLEAAA